MGFSCYTANFGQIEYGDTHLNWLVLLIAQIVTNTTTLNFSMDICATVVRLVLKYLDMMSIELSINAERTA